MESSVTGSLIKNGQTIVDKSVVGRVQSMSKQGVDAISDMASQLRDVAANTSDSIVAYTKKNPAKALAIAAASGALLYAAFKAVRQLRD